MENVVLFPSHVTVFLTWFGNKNKTDCKTVYCHGLPLASIALADYSNASRLAKLHPFARQLLLYTSIETHL